MTYHEITETINIGPVVIDPNNPQMSYENYTIGVGTPWGAQGGVAFPMFVVGTLAVGALVLAAAPAAIDMAAKAAKDYVNTKS